MVLIDMLWWDLNNKSLRRFPTLKNTYWHALVGPEHKIFSAILSYQEYLLSYIGGTWTQHLLGNFQLSRTLIDMHWGDFNTKSFRRFSAIKEIYWHALVGPWHKTFLAYFSYQEYFWTCIDRTLTQILFSDLQQSILLIDMHWLELNPKSFRWISAIKNAYWIALVGLYHKIFSVILSYQEVFIHMHLWDLNTNSFRRFSAIKSTYWHVLVGPEHQIAPAISSYQEYLLTCVGGTWTRNFFGNFELSRILLTYIGETWTQNFSAIFSYQEHLLTCIGGTLAGNLFGIFQLSRILMDMHW